MPFLILNASVGFTVALTLGIYAMTVIYGNKKAAPKCHLSI